MIQSLERKDRIFLIKIPYCKYSRWGLQKLALAYNHFQIGTYFQRW